MDVNFILNKSAIPISVYESQGIHLYLCASEFKEGDAFIINCDLFVFHYGEFITIRYFTTLWVRETVFVNFIINQDNAYSILSLDDILRKRKNNTFFSQVTNDSGYYKIKSILGRQTQIFLKRIKDLGVLVESHSKIEIPEYAFRVLISNGKSKYAYSKGVKYIFERSKKNYLEKTIVNELRFSISHPLRGFDIHFNFQDAIVGRVPINILIGKNATGKSVALRSIAENFMFSQQNSDKINKIILISNTINDRYIKNKREFRGLLSGDYSDYEYFSTIHNKTFEPNVGVETQSLTSLVVKMIDQANNKKMPFNIYQLFEKYIYIILGCKQIRYEFDNGLMLTSIDESVTYLNNGTNKITSVWFLGKSKPYDEEMILSSGQEYITKLITYLLATIENNSVILFDEPENFLHPNLINFLVSVITMLLLDTNSVCIVATHSLFIAREIPRTGVHILEKNNEGQVLTFNPQMESYATDLQKLSNYVFYNKEEGSMFDDNLRNIAKKYSSRKELFDDFKGKSSHEIMISIADRLDEDF